MHITLTDEEFVEFVTALEQEPEDHPKLKALFQKESPFEEGTE